MTCKGIPANRFWPQKKQETGKKLPFQIPADWTDPSYFIFPVTWMWWLIIHACFETEVADFLLWTPFRAI